MGCRESRAQLQVEVQQNTNDVEHQLQLQHILLWAPLFAPSFSAQLEIARACAYSTAVLLLLLVLCAPFGRPGRGTQRRGRGRHERRARAFTPLKLYVSTFFIFHVGAPAAQRPPAAPARRRPTACVRWSVTQLRLLGGQRTGTSGKKRSKRKESNRYSGFPGGPPPLY